MSISENTVFIVEQTVFNYESYCEIYATFYGVYSTMEKAQNRLNESVKKSLDEGFSLMPEDDDGDPSVWFKKGDGKVHRWRILKAKLDEDREF